MNLLDQIPTTWRGVPIQVYNYTLSEGPQTKLHLGAYWRSPIVEDLGHAPTTIRIEGFLPPDWSMLERPILEAMIIAPGAGLLSLPSRGVVYAHCMGAEFSEDTSNIINVRLEFVEVKSPLGIVGDFLAGNLSDDIGTAIVDVQNSAINEIGKTLSSITL